MGVAVEDKEIGGHGFRVTQLGFKQSRKMWVRMTKLLGPAVKELLAGMDAEGADIDMSAVGGALESLLTNMSEADIEYACDAFGGTTQVRPAGAEEFIDLKPVMDELFAGDLPLMFAWLGFALKVNYAGFLESSGALGSLFQQFRGKSKSKSPKG